MYIWYNIYIYIQYILYIHIFLHISPYIACSLLPLHGSNQHFLMIARILRGASHLRPGGHERRSAEEQWGDKIALSVWFPFWRVKMKAYLTQKNGPSPIFFAVFWVFLVLEEMVDQHFVVDLGCFDLWNLREFHEKIRAGFGWSSFS